jgi:hypothetical protein
MPSPTHHPPGVLEEHYAAAELIDEKAQFRQRSVVLQQRRHLQRGQIDRLGGLEALAIQIPTGQSGVHQPEQDPFLQGVLVDKNHLARWHFHQQMPAQHL